MTTSAQPSASGAELLAALRALRPAILAACDEIEEGRRLPLHLIEALKAAGVFRMAMPRAWGGLELDPLAQLAVVEDLSLVSASVGWCAMIGSDGGYYTAFLDQTIARAMYPDIDAPTAGFIAPIGRALPTDGGYTVSGRWPFGSGCQHSAWMASGCVVFDGDAPRRGPDGSPEYRMVFLPAGDCEVLDTWRTTGLRGSGSHDYQVRGLFVPAERTFNFFTTPVQRPGPLYAFPTMFLSNFAGVALGLGRAAIEAVQELGAASRTMGRAALRDEAFVQIAVAEAEANVASARAYLHATLGDLWQTLCAGGKPATRQRAAYRLAMAHAHQSCVEAVDAMYRVAGGASLYSSSPLDRYLRDMHTINQHTVVGPKSYESIGRMLLGLEPGQPFF